MRWEARLKSFLVLKNGTPSHDTFGEAFRVLDAEVPICNIPTEAYAAAENSPTDAQTISQLSSAPNQRNEFDTSS